MDIKHQEETDKGAEKYLIKIKKLHQQYLSHYANKKPVKPRGLITNTQARLFDAQMAEYKQTLANCTMRVEIINTNANQLNLSI